MASLDQSPALDDMDLIALADEGTSARSRRDTAPLTATQRMELPPNLTTAPRLSSNLAANDLAVPDIEPGTAEFAGDGDETGIKPKSKPRAKRSRKAAPTALPPATRVAATSFAVTFFLFLTTIYVWASLLSFHPEDSPFGGGRAGPLVAPAPASTYNFCGFPGAWLSFHLFHYLGNGAYVLAGVLLFVVVVRAIRGYLGDVWFRVIGTALLIAVTSTAFAQIGSPDPQTPITGPGGVLGLYVAHIVLEPAFKDYGWLILLGGLIVGTALTFDDVLVRTPGAAKWVHDQAKQVLDAAAQARAQHEPVPMIALDVNSARVADTLGQQIGKTVTRLDEFRNRTAAFFQQAAASARSAKQVDRELPAAENSATQRQVRATGAGAGRGSGVQASSPQAGATARTMDDEAADEDHAAAAQVAGAYTDADDALAEELESAAGVAMVPARTPAAPRPAAPMPRADELEDEEDELVDPANTSEPLVPQLIEEAHEPGEPEDQAAGEVSAEEESALDAAVDPHDVDPDDGGDAGGSSPSGADEGTFEDVLEDAPVEGDPPPLAAPPARLARPAPKPPQTFNYDLPSLELLDEPDSTYSAEQEKNIRDKGKILQDTLDTFHVDAKVVRADTGPVITMFEVEPSPGVKVAQISGLSNDVARALRAQTIRIVAPIPGKNTVGIEVPNDTKEKVRLKELFRLVPDAPQRMGLPVYLGKDASGNALVTDLTKWPHGLVAGTTGSGKSVCINTIIMSVLLTQKPDNVKLILVDPKMVEMTVYKDVPHLLSPIITDMNKASGVLDWAVNKMEERYALLAEAGVRDLKSYNKLGPQRLRELFDPLSPEEEAKIPAKLPIILIIIDEFADLMMTNGKEIEQAVARLAQKSRAVGIHLILATQRPSANVVTGLIKSNLPTRVAFRVASRTDSRIVLDQNGAEVLLGQGDMLFLPPGASKLVRAQGTYIEDNELHGVLDYLKDKGRPEFSPELLGLKNVDLAGGEKDELFDEAVRCVLETRRGSVSLLQRKFGIGYARASRIIEQMAEAGILGAHKNAQAREVTMTVEEYEALLAQRDRETAPLFSETEDDFPQNENAWELEARQNRERVAAEADESGDDVPAEYAGEERY